MSPSALQDLPLIIVGAGYAGKTLFDLARTEGWNVLATSRHPKANLPQIPSPQCLLFDLDRPETWSHLPHPAHLAWCFPVVFSESLKQFFARWDSSTGKIIVFGSTSAYQAGFTPVTEQTPLHSHQPRVQGEEYLRSTFGAIILRLAGLYGPGRNPLNWIRKGKIRNRQKWVNLIHVQDAAGACLQALTQSERGETYIVSDGIPRKWEEIFVYASNRWKIQGPHATEQQMAGKWVSNHKLLTELEYSLHFPDLYAALEEIETSSP